MVLLVIPFFLLSIQLLRTICSKNSRNSLIRIRVLVYKSILLRFLGLKEMLKLVRMFLWNLKVNKKIVRRTYVYKWKMMTGIVWGVKQFKEKMMTGLSILSVNVRN